MVLNRAETATGTPLRPPPEESQRKPPSAIAQDLLVGIPDEVLTVIRSLEKDFYIEPSVMKQITEEFVSELEKGLTVEGGDLPMNITWVIGWPTGEEQGQFLTLDIGGTNMRVCGVRLATRQNEIEVTSQKSALPEEIKNSTAEEFWDHVAGCVQQYLHKHHSGGQTSTKLPLAVTFSYPVFQSSIRNGVLQYWTKGLNVSGVEGQDIVKQLEEALERKKLPVYIIALANDTTGTLITSRFHDPGIEIGSIFSTGCNAAYMEEVKAVPKLKDSGLPGNWLVAINTEYGAFDNKRLYLGELLRVIMLDLHASDKLFRGQDVTQLRLSNAIDTRFLSQESKDIISLFHDRFDIDLQPYELKVCRYLVELVVARGARLYACGIAGICKKKGIESCHVGVDGSVFHNYPQFRRRAARALREILDWPQDSEDLVVLQQATYGSEVGAALIAALTMRTSHSERPDKMRFRSQLTNVLTFSKLTASLASLGKICWMRLEDSTVRFTIIPDQGTQVWAQVQVDTIFDETSYILQSNTGVINLEVPVGALHRALRSALGATSAQIRLTKKGNIPLLALTINTSSWTAGRNALGVANSGVVDGEHDGAVLPRSEARERETVITQEIPVKVLHESVIEGLHEPRCPDPDVHIILPSLVQLKSISERFTKLASTKGSSTNANTNINTTSSDSAGNTVPILGASSPKLELSANMHGSLRLAISTDEFRIASEWTGLVNPPLDPAQLSSQTEIDQLPSERRRALGNDEEAGWARVRIDGRDWGRVLSVGRLSPKVVACFIHNTALVLYVYLPSSWSSDESCLTYYINSYVI
ncbi:hypothetical protein ASPZODRAFT_154346 [Penicilliopsis zonata CBS 506.65]|uniref:hexokinase n=1 Tax=Penicilliopsis zonata CBS 506.65 TaxID=1073090 RepID=A0A1L9S9L3_9EURO|nr:hypothetical protein ASPZODRAFT_154346 [Penicilliopsis zonata CBS 506.65]OJJ43843.1 hypothetical protein ASPZODRAFT_154346 [Penicilliopsis zonata CBS 506.65]